MPNDRTTIEKYLDDKVGTWGGFLDICAFANAETIDADTRKALKFHGDDLFSVLKLFAEHYEWVKCDSRAIADLWLRANTDATLFKFVISAA